MWQATVAAVGIVSAIAWPLWQHAQKRAAEATAAESIERLFESQERFQHAHAAFATDLRSLTEPCPGRDPWLEVGLVARLAAAGYQLHLRVAEGGLPQPLDCHGYATASDYYASVTPVLAEVAGQRAYARSGRGDAWVFVDGVAPHERDFQPGGLAIPLRQLDTFTIP